MEPVPPPPRPRWHPVVRAVLFLLAFAALQGAFGILIALVLLALGREPELSSGFLLAVYNLTAIPLLGIAWLFTRFLDRRSLSSLGLRWPDGGKARARRQAAVVPLATLVLLGAWLLLLEPLPGADIRLGGWSEEVQGPPGPGADAARLLLLLLGFLVQGGVEELVVRGYIYRALKERWSWWEAAAAASLLFATLHAANPDFSWIAMLNTFLAGVLLALLVERSGSLWSATLAHGVWNFAVACVASLPISGLRTFRLLDLAVQGPEALTGGGFGPEGSLLLSLMALPVAAALTPRPPLPAPTPRPGEGDQGPSPPEVRPQAPL